MRQAAIALFSLAMACAGGAALVVLLTAPGDGQALESPVRSVVLRLAVASVALVFGATACQVIAVAMPV